MLGVQSCRQAASLRSSDPSGSLRAGSRGGCRYMSISVKAWSLLVYFPFWERWYTVKEPETCTPLPIVPSLLEGDAASLRGILFFSCEETSGLSSRGPVHQIIPDLDGSDGACHPPGGDGLSAA